MTYLPPVWAGEGGDRMKARIFRLAVLLGSLSMVVLVLGAPKKWR